MSLCKREETQIPWRDRSEARPVLAPIDRTCSGIGASWSPSHENDTLHFTIEEADFLVGLRFTASTQCDIAVEYAVEGGAGEAVAGGNEQAQWCCVAEHRCAGRGVEELIWPDVGAHCRWLLRFHGNGTSPATTLHVHELLRWDWGIRLDDLRMFTDSRLENDTGAGTRRSPHLAAHQQHLQHLVESGELVLATHSHLLDQLYHESDLLGWGAPIPFPCFMTIWAKPASRSDFASFVHRFTRRADARPPLLVLSGSSVAARQRLRSFLKSLLLPQYVEVVRGLEDDDAVIDALWKSEQQREQPQQQPLSDEEQDAPPSLAEVNRRLRAAQLRLGIADEDVRPYAPQFLRRDPLMLLLTREAFGTWAPNRVAEELGGHDIFRTYARFSCVDGVVCGADAVWLHQPMAFYVPAPDVVRGDKRSEEFFTRLAEQCGLIARLLARYEEEGWIDAPFRSGLEQGILNILKA